MEQDGIGTGIGFRDLLRSFRRVLRIHSIFSLYYKKMTPRIYLSWTHGLFVRIRGVVMGTEHDYISYHKTPDLLDDAPLFCDIRNK
jgi:hypothetical protein